MHTADALHDRYLQGLSTPGEINAIARIEAAQRSITFEQALVDVHEGVGYELSSGEEQGAQPFPWTEVSRSLVPR